jgi:hypothetical protein
MKYIKCLLPLSLFFFIFSCNQEPEPIKVKLEILIDNLNEKEIQEIKKILEPIGTINDTFIAFNPIILKRLDRKDKKEIDYEENIREGTDPNNIYTVERAIKTSIESKDLELYLKSEPNNEYNFEPIKNKKNEVFFEYNEEGEDGDESSDIYEDIDKLRESIKEVILNNKNIKKIIIAYNINRKPIEVVDSPIVKKTTQTTVGTPPPPDGCNQKLSATDVQDFVSKLANVNYLLSCREELRDKYIGKFFNNGAKVNLLNNNGDKMSESPIKAFCQRLITTHKYYEVVESEDNNGKISTINLRTK